ncbi:methyltransferase domain-containing protein [Actinomycetota bacterium Odt1-20B]
MNADDVAEDGAERLASVLVGKGVLSADWLGPYAAARRDLFVPDVIWPGRVEGSGQGESIDRREDPDAWFRAVYSDVSLTTQWDDGKHAGRGKGRVPTCSVSQPSMVFSMLKDLDVRRGHRVLEIGTGMGWSAGLLSERVGGENVFSIEFDPNNARSARRHVAGAGYKPTLIFGDGSQGYLPGGPYDRVLFTASLLDFPPDVIRQCREGAVIVAPYSTTYGGGANVRLRVGEEGCVSGKFTGSSAFMRLRQQRGAWPGTDVYLRSQKWPADGVRRMTSLNPDDVGTWAAMFVIGLQTRGFAPWMESYGDGSYTLWLRDRAVKCWATVDFIPEAEEFEVRQSGHRELWTEVETAYSWWTGQGKPDPDRFGMTVKPMEEATYWLDSPGRPVPVTV